LWAIEKMRMKGMKTLSVIFCEVMIIAAISSASFVTNESSEGTLNAQVEHSAQGGSPDEYTYYWILGQNPNQTTVYLYAKDGATVTFNGTIAAPVVVDIPADTFVWYNVGDLGYAQVGIQWYFLEMTSNNKTMVNFDRVVTIRTGSSTYEDCHGDMLHDKPPMELNTTHYYAWGGSGALDDILVMYAHETTNVTVRRYTNWGQTFTKIVTFSGLYVSNYIANWLGPSSPDWAPYGLKVIADKPIASALFDEWNWWPDPNSGSGYYFGEPGLTQLYNEYMNIYYKPDYSTYYILTANNLSYKDEYGNPVGSSQYYAGETSKIVYHTDIGYDVSTPPFLVHSKGTEAFMDSWKTPTATDIKNVAAYMGWNSSLANLEIYTDKDSNITIYDGRNYNIVKTFSMSANTIFVEALNSSGFNDNEPFLAVVASNVPVYQEVRIPYYIRQYPGELGPLLQVTVDTSPGGLQIEVDGIQYTAPHILWCIPGSPHIMNAPSPQISGSTRYIYASWSDGGAQSHTIFCNTTATYTANFNTEYLVNVNTNPTGLDYWIDDVLCNSQTSFWWEDGSNHWLNTTSPQQITPDTRYIFMSWSDSGAQNHSVTINGPEIYIANFNTEFQVTVDTNPTGLNYWVDDVLYNSQTSFWWEDSSNHWLNTTSPQQVSSDTRYVFASWSDSGAQNHPVTSSAPETYIANFNLEFQVAVDTNPSGLDYWVDDVPHNSLMSFWFEAGSTHWLNTTSPQQIAQDIRFIFASWSSSGSQNHSITCNAPGTYIADFITEYRIEVATSPQNLQLIVDGSAETAPQTYWWADGSLHVLSAPSPQVSADTTYQFDRWSDGGAQSHYVVINAPGIYTATFAPLVAVGDFIVTANPSMQITTPGSSVDFTVTVTALNGYEGPQVTLSLQDDSSGITGSCNPASVEPTGSCTLTVNLDSSVSADSYILTVQGSNGTTERKTNVTLLVIAPEPIPVEINMKPFVALIFALILVLLGAWAAHLHRISVRGC